MIYKWSLIKKFFKSMFKCSKIPERSFFFDLITFSFYVILLVFLNHVYLNVIFWDV